MVDGKTKGSLLTCGTNVLHQREGAASQRGLPAREVRGAAHGTGGGQENGGVADADIIAGHAGRAAHERVAGARRVEVAAAGRSAALSEAATGGHGLRVVAGAQVIV